MRKKYFRKKVAVITGAASGIGKEFAIALAKMGTNLVITDINMERLEATKKELETFGVKVMAEKCDVSKALEVKKLAKDVIEQVGDIHFLFSNAGIAVGGLFETLNIAQWDRIININIYGMINMVKEFIPKMSAQGFGHVIVTGSIASTLGIGGLGPYNTTKFANAGFCESLFSEYHQKGIDVSIICPFPLKTNLMETAGIGIPPELLEGVDPQIMKKAVDAGKTLYWTEFTKKQSILKGFAGGLSVERSVKIYMRKIRKKKLYIFERRYGRFLQVLKGLWPGLYKWFISSMGKRHVKLLNNTVNAALEMANKEKSKALQGEKS